MEYRVIDRDTWPRKEYFEHYLQNVPCTYSLTTKLDITNLKAARQKLYPALLYFLTKTVNRHEAFRTALRPDGTLVVYRGMLPFYTVFHQDTKTFSNIWTDFSEDYGTFCRRYDEDMQRYGAIHTMTPKSPVPENVFNVSMIPWTSFDGFNLNLRSFDHLLPIFTLGQYRQTEGRYRIPLAVQVHHAVCDGYHVSCFINDLQEAIRTADFEGLQ